MAMKATIYLCGPVTGHEDEAPDRFRRAERLLECCGYNVENPLKRSVPGVAWHTALRNSLRAMLDCTGVALLEGWETSRGACLEKGVADDMDMPVAPLNEWTRGCHE